MAQRKAPVAAVEDWPTLSRIAGAGYNDGIICLAAVELVERLNDPAVHGPINEAGAGRAGRLLADSVLFRLHLLLTRAYAPVAYKDDRHLRAAIEFLTPERIAEQQYYGPNGLEPWAERQQHLADAVRKFTALATDPRLKKLKHMRDKMLAHWAVPSIDVERPSYNDLFRFARDTAEVWERLSYGAGEVSIPIINQVDAYIESADAFWSVWRV
jgi:hypothetical protein